MKVTRSGCGYVAFGITTFVMSVAYIGSLSERPKTPKKSAITEQPRNEKPSIAVTSTIVKKVNGKHRYFFHLRNNAPQPFTGDVTITLLDAKHDHSNVSETYEIENPMQPGLGASVYFEVHTGPAAVHGEYGNTRFKYEVKSGGKIVDKGTGRITDNYEDLTR